jgi:Protein of unknown function (DUF3489)
MTTQNTTLSATQIFVLNAAADNAQGRIETFPDNVKGGARAKVLSGLQTRGWIMASTDGFLCITDSGRGAIGREIPVIKARAPTKQNMLTALLEREGGAAISALMAATGWQKHSVCGALSTLNKTLGGTIQSEKRDGERVYWIGATLEQVEASA